MIRLTLGFTRTPPKKKHKKSKKRIQFSKMWLVGCVTISLVFTALSYVLAFLDKSTVESLSMTIIETLWNVSGGSFAAYALMNSARAVAEDFGLRLKPLGKGGENNGVVSNSGFSSFNGDDCGGNGMGL